MGRFPLAAALILGALSALAHGQGVEEGRRQLVVERVELSGKPRSQPATVARYLRLAAGDDLESGDLLAGRQRLEETGFYKSVEVYARPGSEKGLVVVVVELVEHVQPQYRFEGGHGELDGWYIVPVSFVYDNPWGRGHKLDWKWYLGSHGSGNRLHYQHPRVFAGAATLDLTWFSETRSYPQWVQGKQIREDVSAGGISMRLTGLRGRFGYLFGQLRTQEYDPESEAALEQLLGDGLGKAMVTTLGLGWHRDTRDQSGYPMSGFWGQAVVDRALGGTAGDIVFTRLDLEGRWYRRLEGRNVAAVRVHAGLTSEEAPFYERYYLGGPYSLRRYEEAEATPVGWGTRTLQVQSELRLPFGGQDAGGPRNTAVLFYDVGGIWLPGEAPVPADLEHAMGVGYRRRVRVLGVLRLDLSLPVTPTEGDSDWEAFHLWLALGRTF